MYNYVVSTEKPFIILASKADKIAVTKVDGAVEKLQNELNPLKDFTFLPFSAERKIYTEPVWQKIDDNLLDFSINV